VKKLGVVILDEEKLFRTLLSRFLSANGRWDVVGDAGCSCAGLQLCADRKPDLILLDLKMPRVNGVELAVHLAQKTPSSRIVGVTEFKDDYAVSQAINCHLSGCIEKAQSPEELLQALEVIGGGGTYYSPRFARTAAALASDPVAFPKILSHREQQILGLVAEGLTSRVIGERLGLSARTVETHRHNVMKKMNLTDLAGLMRFAIQHGFREVNCPGLQQEACG
jgi:two-component system, NarL family, nitrate/nitrite response regulator NarL